MKPVDLETAKLILDFSGGDPSLVPLGQLQMEGAVALQNMLANPNVGMGYLADEVGMGKTYIALGVVALMRYFNPSLRVLYICPSRNVQEKWYGREHPNFIKKNVITRNFNIRTPQGTSGTPAISCDNIEELIAAATTGYYGDIFVRMSSFSLAMGDDEDALRKEMKWLKERVPVSVLGGVKADKESVKKAYAKAVNYLLPTFDLVVIDEAHNFKHSFGSSARNQALSRIFGFRDDETENYRSRVKRALLLSATPFDVDPLHLFNQLNLVGKGNLMPGADEWDDKGLLRDCMARFMVRRLNELVISGKRHTRNMYRREWRKGERAEVGFESDEHKLITALVQKHIGDLLDREGGNPAFQLGLLASFESYEQTARSGPVEFDGEKPLEGKTDAQDRHLIGAIRDSYVVDHGFGKSLPHPKMDQVSRELAHLALSKSRKQLIFVRRVKSVPELKQKLDDEYDVWLQSHIETKLAGQTDQRSFMRAVIDLYHDVRKRRDEDISGGEVIPISGDEEEQLPPKNDTLFNWFFRGETPSDLDELLSSEMDRWRRPDVLRKSLTSKKDANVLLFEFNWAAWAARTVLGRPLDQLLASIGESGVADILNLATLVTEDDKLSVFLSLQQACLKWMATKYPEASRLSELGNYLVPLIREGDYQIDLQEAKRLLTLHTLFSQFYEMGLASKLFSSPEGLVEKFQNKDGDIYEDIHRVEIHRQLLAQAFRTGHSFIDLYLSRLKIGESELDDSRRKNWLQQICWMLDDQLTNDDFSTAVELSRLDSNLDLVIKSNMPGVFNIGQAELRIWLSRQLPSSAPVIGANGETSANRSVQARKFRMPGYPLILVSTDVFQEGEDLHTFCDSVVHYGLSSAPISIEQKTGRVDRVGAFAHRRLLNYEDSGQIEDEDFIQVRFPYVKQSIEAIQVRVMCNNLNAFIGSLHEIGGEGQTIEEFVNSSKELASRNEIPDQLLSFLKSPYVPPKLLERNPALIEQVKGDNLKFEVSVKHVNELLANLAESPLDRDGLMRTCIDSLNGEEFYVQIDSARSCGEVLLRVLAKDKWEEPSDWSSKEIREYQGWQHGHCLFRTYGVREKGGIALYREAEMLAGGSELTSKEDVIGLFERFVDMSDGLGEPVGLIDVPDFDDVKANTYLSSEFHWNGTFSSKRHRKSLELLFQFNDDKQRKHRIEVKEINGYCFLEAMVMEKAVGKSFSKDRLLELTWLRNRNIDLVEFLLRPDGCLVGRTFHPLKCMDFEEFIFAAFILAVEADRLEYLIKEPDDY